MEALSIVRHLGHELGGDGVGAVEWGGGAGGADVSRHVSWKFLLIPLGIIN